MVILIDTNIILDILLKREPFYQNSSSVINLCVEGNIDGYIAVHSITNLFFILRKNYTIKERRELLKNLLDVLTVAGAGHQQVISALERNDFNDFEDCLQLQCAMDIQADYIITRNLSDFHNSEIPALLPEDFLDKAL